MLPGESPLHLWLADDNRVHVAEPDAALFLCGRPVTGSRIGGSGNPPQRSCRGCYNAPAPENRG